MNWLPIESAPTGDVGPDEEFPMLLVVNRRGAIEIVNALRVDSAKEAAGLDDEVCWFTHWMPLPAPPEPQA